jgi:hypothetical protein
MAFRTEVLATAFWVTGRAEMEHNSYHWTVFRTSGGPICLQCLAGEKPSGKITEEGLVRTSLAAEPLLALAVTVTSEQRLDSVLQSIVQGLASQPGVALARI